MNSRRSTRKPGRSSRASTNGNGSAIEITGCEPIRDSDMVLFIRNGIAAIRTPEHDGGYVPEDFIVLLGCATAWHDPRFRAMMRAVVKDQERNGLYAGIIA